MKISIALSVLSFGAFFLTGCALQTPANPPPSAATPPAVQEPSQPVPSATPSAAPAEAVPSLSSVYNNSDYGFSLTFLRTWDGFIAKNRPIDGGASGVIDSIDFGFAVQDSIFNIGMYPKDLWGALQSGDGPKPNYLGENDRYVFGYSGAQSVKNDAMDQRSKEIPEIVKTFRLQGSL